MKLSDIFSTASSLQPLNEAVRLTSLEPGITSRFVKELQTAFDGITEEVLEMYDEYDFSISDDDITIITHLVSRLITTKTCDRSIPPITEFVNAHPAVHESARGKIQIMFARGMKADGVAEGTVVRINRDLVRVAIVERCINAIIQSMPPDLPVAQQITNLIKELQQLQFSTIVNNRQSSETFALREAILHISGTIIHELTHTVQHARQSHRDTTEYRSYLEPNAKRFRNMVNALANSTLAQIGMPEAEVTKAYRASPQEIPAFAQQIALMILDYLGFPASAKIATKKEVLDELSRVMPRYISFIFDNSKTKIDEKVYRRYAKLIYQEVVENIDQYY